MDGQRLAIYDEPERHLHVAKVAPHISDQPFRSLASCPAPPRVVDETHQHSIPLTHLGVRDREEFGEHPTSDRFHRVSAAHSRMSTQPGIFKSYVWQ